MAAPKVICYGIYNLLANYEVPPKVVLTSRFQKEWFKRSSSPVELLAAGPFCNGFSPFSSLALWSWFFCERKP
jgi:hypothetical protein